jgi:hypothetical protein
MCGVGNGVLAKSGTGRQRSGLTGYIQHISMMTGGERLLELPRRGDRIRITTPVADRSVQGIVQ